MKYPLSHDRLKEIVVSVGESLVQWKARGLLSGNWVGDQMKAEVDLMAHQLYENFFMKETPQIPMLSEESVSHDLSAEAYWLVDPLDGTASFVGGFPTYVTQVALMQGGRPVMSAVFAPELKEYFSAGLGEGSYKNGKRLKVNKEGTGKILIDNYPEPRGLAKSIMTDLSIEKYIECGSLGLKVVRIADGTATVFAKNTKVRVWDMAPPALILSEAGGILTDGIGHAMDFTKIEFPGLIASNRQDTVGKVADIQIKNAVSL